jgi:hypothetical protein
MPASRCPHCKSPLTAEESLSGTCPACHGALAAQQPQQSQQPEQPAAEDWLVPTEEAPGPKFTGFRLLVAGAVVVLVLAVGGLAYYWYKVSHATPDYARTSESSTRTSAPVPFASSPTGTASEEGGHAATSFFGVESKRYSAGTTAAETSSSGSTLAVASASRATASGRSATGTRGAATPSGSAVRPAKTGNATPTKSAVKPPDPPPPPKPKPIEPAVPVDRVVNNPDGEYKVDPLTGNKFLRLKGAVGKLVVGAVGNSSRLDASALAADEIAIAGPLGGTAVIDTNAPGGDVEVSTGVGEQVKLTIRSPDGHVTLGAAGAAGTDIGGSAQVDITAKEVNIYSRVTGGAVINITLTSGGRIKLNQVDGGAKILYRKNERSDPNPQIDRGAVTEGGLVKLVD